MKYPFRNKLRGALDSHRQHRSEALMTLLAFTIWCDMTCPFCFCPSHSFHLLRTILVSARKNSTSLTSQLSALLHLHHSTW